MPEGQVRFSVVDITRPRDPELLAKTRGSTALPVLEIEGGWIIKESMVILEYLEACFPEPAVARRAPYERAVENMLCALCPELVAGRTYSSFVFDPHWSRRPWHPADKYAISATDADLGLVPSQP